MKGELLNQTSNMPEDSKNKQTDLIPFNDNIPQITVLLLKLTRKCPR